MKIITYNVNGIRAAISKGFVDFLKQQNADVICLQEIKANVEQIPVEEFAALGYHCYWYSAQKKGYSGVGILTKIKPSNIKDGCEHDLFDAEGRVITATINDIKIVSAYFPSGTTGDIRQDVKYDFLDHAFNFFMKMKEENENLVVCGDYNICHKEIDIHNPISNKNSSGFLPEERAWMDKWFNSGFNDSFRLYNPQADQYTWWSFRAGARQNNKGWRIDYISTSDNLEVQNSGILPNDYHSDHCASWCKINI